jgi:hypothetical protein
MISILNFTTSHHQFYIADSEYIGDTGSNDFWTTEASSERLAVAEDILGVATECYGHVHGELTILNETPEVKNLDFFDHVVEGGLEIRSGNLHVLDCPNNSIEFEVRLKPGNYRVRIYSSNLESVIDDDGDDYYTIEIWPDINKERLVLKR